MSFDPIAQLRDAGAPVDLLSDEQRGVIAMLSPEETSVILSVNQRVSAVTPADVEGHSVSGGIVF